MRLEQQMRYLIEEQDFNFSNFNEFAQFLKVEENQRQVHRVLTKNPYNSTIKSWKEDPNNWENFDDFYEYWLNLDTSKLDETYADAQFRTVYVHKNDIKNNKNTLILNGQDSNYYESQINKYIGFIKNRSCDYSESGLIAYIDKWFETTVNESPFEAIVKLNEFSTFLFQKENKNHIKFLKMRAAGFDNNFSACALLGEELISSYQKGFIENINEPDNNWNGIGMNVSEIYRFTVFSLYKLKDYEKALNYNNHCFNNEYLQYKELNFYQGLILLEFNKDEEACRYFNKEYLNGNADAKWYIENFCQ